MNDMHAGLRLYRNQLRDAIALDLQRRRGRVTHVAVPVLAAAAVAVATVVAVSSLGTHAPAADAAILHRISAALAPKPGTILHERALVSIPGQTSAYELWAQADSPYAYRVIKWGHEGTGQGQPDDIASTVRQLVQSGQAHVAATTLDGVAAYKLTINGSSDRFLNGTVYVAQDNYHPLQIETGAGCLGTCTETIRYQTYEYLPSNAANLSLLHSPSSGN